MRYLFIAGLKLLGVLCLYWALGDIAQLGSVLALQPHYPTPWVKNTFLLPWIAYGLIHLLFSLMLLFWPEGIATWLKMNDEDFHGLQVMPQAFLYAAMVGVSIFILLSASVPLMKEFFRLLDSQINGRLLDTSRLSSLFAILCQIVLAFIVLARARNIARTLVKPKE